MLTTLEVAANDCLRQIFSKHSKRLQLQLTQPQKTQASYYPIAKLSKLPPWILQSCWD